MGNQPIIKKRDHSNSVAIFKDEYTTAQGEARTRHSVAIQRSYKDKNGEWKQTALNCFIEDLLPLSSLLESAYMDFNNLLEKSRNNKTPEQSSTSGRASAPKNDDYDDDIPF